MHEPGPKTELRHTIIACRFERLLARKAPARDPELISFTRQLMDPPSRHVMRKLPWGGRSTPQAELAFSLLNKQVCKIKQKHKRFKWDLHGRHQEIFQGGS